MASIFKRKQDKGNPRAAYYIDYFDHKKKRRRKKGFPDKALTQRLAARLENDVMLRLRGLIDPMKEEATNRKNSAIEEYILEFEKSISRGDNTKKHVKQTVNRIRRLVSEADIKAPADIDFMTVETVMREMVESGEFGHKTHNHYLQAMDQFCKWLSHGQRQILPCNPIAGMERLNTEIDVRHQRRALTQDEFWKLVDSAASSGVEIQCFDGFDRAKIYMISYFTGLRRKEIASLTPMSFNLTDNPPTLTIQAGNSKHRKKDVLPLHPELVNILSEWLDGKESCEELFPKLAKRRTWLMVKKDLERVGIPYETADGIADFHAAGRHTHITELLRNGATLPQAKELARHSDVRTTMKYTHIGIDDQAKALSSLPAKKNIDGQHSGQQLDDPGCQKASADDQSKANEETENEANDADCRSASVAVAELPRGERGFDPRRHPSTIRHQSLRTNSPPAICWIPSSWRMHHPTSD